ncbi:MAG TPA: hypothetical protein VFU09_06630 [Candidatus Udaeobacter sp.]|nr:hypothetical protein [Candidatus Udaeobacter sp.]
MNRRRRTVPGTEPNRAAAEIASPCTCGTEIRAAGEVPSTRAVAPGHIDVLARVAAQTEDAGQIKQRSHVSNLVADLRLQILWQRESRPLS